MGIIAAVTAFLFGAVAGYGVFTIHRSFSRVSSRKSEQLGPVALGPLLQTTKVRKPRKKRPKKAVDDHPTPKWPGKPEEYEIVLYRDDTFRIIEKRIPVPTLETLSNAIKALRQAQRPGKLNRTQGHKVVEILKWT